jgi:hypothetical protein
VALKVGGAPAGLHLFGDYAEAVLASLAKLSADGVARDHSIPRELEYLTPIDGKKLSHSVSIDEGLKVS